MSVPEPLTFLDAAVCSGCGLLVVEAVEPATMQTALRQLPTCNCPRCGWAQWKPLWEYLNIVGL